MKRVKAECLEQTLHFMLKDGLDPESARNQVRHEYEAYKSQLERRSVRCKIIEEIEQPDGSLMVKLKRQNNSHPVGSYMN